MFLRKSLSAKITIIMMLMIITGTTVTGIISYLTYKQDSINYQVDIALGIAESFASTIDGDKYEESMKTLVVNDFWHETVAKMDEIKIRTGVTYIYMASIENNEVIYFGEGYLPGEERIASLGDTDPLENYGQELVDVMNSPVSIGTQPYDGGADSISGKEYGILVSAFSPILNSQGKTVGAVCVDFGIDEVLKDSDAFGLKNLIYTLLTIAVFMSLIYVYMHRSLGNPIRKLTKASMQIAEGDMMVDLTSNRQDEIGTLSSAFSQVTGTIDNLMKDLESVTYKHLQGDFDARLDDSRFTGAYKDVATGVNTMVDRYVKDYMEILTVVDEFGKGNFEKELPEYPGKKIIVNESVERLRENLKNVSSEISILAHAATAGNLSERIETEEFEGDWKNLVSELNELLNVVVEPIHESASVLDRISKGDLDAKITGDYRGDFSIIKNSLNVMTDEISSYIQEIAEVLSKVAKNDLNQSITREYIGQFSVIKDSINNIIEQLNTVIKSISVASEQVAKGSSDLFFISQLLTGESITQTELVNHIIKMIEKIGVQTLKNTDNAANAMKLSVVTNENAKKGTVEMQKMVNSMDAIRESSSNISAIIKVIEEIAFQTNLLALNAAVEAARAGEHGKSFSVVAEEVRNLAARSQKAVEETTLLILASVQNVNEGVEMVKLTAESLDDIVANVSDVSGLVNEIVDSSGEQAKWVAELEKDVISINDSILNNSKESEKSSALSEVLAAQAEESRSLINMFKL